MAWPRPRTRHTRSRNPTSKLNRHNSRLPWRTHCLINLCRVRCIPGTSSELGIIRHERNIARMGMLENKVAFVTGASSGIGAGAAQRFAEEGAKVVLVDMRPEDGE